MIIAFTGQAGNGKTTAAELVEEMLGGARRFSFAAALKDVAVQIFAPTFARRPPDDYFGVGCAFYGTQKDKEHPSRYLGGRTGRQFLQELGSLARKYNPDVWLNHLRDDYPFTIIDDCRYRNEADRVHELGGVVIGLRRGEQIVGGHASESQLVEQWDEMVDYTIQNNGGLDELREKIRCILEEEGLI